MAIPTKFLNPLNWCLSKVYWVLAKIHYRYLAYQLKNQSPPPLPLWVMGGIEIGGSGKTSLTLKFAEILTEQKVSFAIICPPVEKFRWPFFTEVEISPSTSYEKVSDEALLIYQKVSAPLILTNNRFRTWRRLANKKQFQLVLSDDGCQDPRLKSASRFLIHPAQLFPPVLKPFPFGNQRIIEPWQLQNCHWILDTTGINSQETRGGSELFRQQKAFLEPEIGGNSLQTKMLTDYFTFHRKLIGWELLIENPFILITSIANPHRLLQSLHILKCTPLKCYFLPDHSQRLSRVLYRVLKKMPGIYIALTEKDRVKLKGEVPQNIIILRQDIQLSSPLKSWIQDQMGQLPVKSIQVKECT